MARCPVCRRGFFPLREALGFDARQLTPLLVQRITVAAAATRSFPRAVIVPAEVGGRMVSARTIARVVHDVGAELAGRRDADPKTDDALARRPEGPPALAVVECDGGRTRTREPGPGPRVHPSGEGWRVTKNARLIRGSRRSFDEDPQPEPPGCFGDPQHGARIAETETLSVASTRPGGASGPRASRHPEPPLPATPADWRPQRLVRTALSSLATSDDFGAQMAREAKRRRSREAEARAFRGDGLPWSWSIRKRHFRSFTPILGFIHVLSYLFLAAKAVHEASAEAWDQYLAWMRDAWQGELAQVLEELRAWQAKRGTAPAGVPETDPRRVLERTITYLENNRVRRNYPEYRRAGLPVTTAWMGSLVKEMNYRVKGTEMFWNDPEGAEAILQVRAAALREEERLASHRRTRPGCPFTRRPKSPKLTPQGIRC